MTDEELRAIEEACAKATPGPWTYECRSVGNEESNPDWPTSDFLQFHVYPTRVTPGAGLSGPKEVEWGRGDYYGRDAHFIANSRQWIPALLAEVRKLRQVEANLKETLQLSNERWAGYEESVRDTNQLLDEAGLHVGSQDLSTLVRQLIADATDGRMRRLEEREACAKLAEEECDGHDLCGCSRIAAAIRARGAA